jgi:hypothetical protein
MVGRVLTGNGITRYDEGRDELLQLCRQRQMSSTAAHQGGEASSGVRGTSWISTSQPSTSA